jgi:hypothetical protein
MFVLKNGTKRLNGEKKMIILQICREFNMSLNCVLIYLKYLTEFNIKILREIIKK